MAARGIGSKAYEPLASRSESVESRRRISRVSRAAWLSAASDKCRAAYGLSPADRSRWRRPGSACVGCCSGYGRALRRRAESLDAAATALRHAHGLVVWPVREEVYAATLKALRDQLHDPEVKRACEAGMLMTPA